MNAPQPKNSPPLPGRRRLLAKSSRGSRAARSLVDHTRDVIEAFQSLFGTSEQATELTSRWCRFFRVTDTGAFLSNGLAASAVHDWGKANDGFQTMLLHKGRQLLRHEQISALMMTCPTVWQWLGSNPNLDRELILSAVVGHHLKARDADFGQPETEIDVLLRTRWDDGEFQAHLNQVAGLLKLAHPLPSEVLGGVPQVWGFEAEGGIADLGAALDCARDRLERFGDMIEGESGEPRRRLLWTVRAGLIVADAAGSGLFREAKPVCDWISAAFDPESRLDDSAIWEKVIEPRVNDLKDRGRWVDWNAFQNACADPEKVPARALLLAPCGSGKTLAAWRWIARRCQEEKRGCVIFLYPTRGTATEGYRDYVAHAGSEEAALVHGTADFDLDGIHPDLDEEKRINAARLFALRQWPKRLFSATVDQFLGFLQHGYGPTCHLPLLADSVLVFDEIHSYDRGMFSALIQFLNEFDVPALCMTATLLGKRRQQLERGSRELGERGLVPVNGLEFSGEGGELKTIAEYPRYQVTTVANAETAAEIVREALNERKRVLWVVNTVERAQQEARGFAEDLEVEELATPGKVPIFCYHSRYRLKNRRTWHNRVIEAFRRTDKLREPVLAVTTQVCEMSLDLDADLVVTEYAPATSLVQRMGRCCRSIDAHNEKRTGEVVLYSPENAAPYTQKDMLGVTEFIERMRKLGTVSQSQLEDLLADVPQAVELPKECRFIHSGPWAAMGEENFRDIDDHTRQALLPGDVEEYVRLRRGKKPWEADGLIVPVPRQFIDSEPDQRLPSWLHIAVGGRYREPLGYCDEQPPPMIV